MKHELQEERKAILDYMGVTIGALLEYMGALYMGGYYWNTWGHYWNTWGATIGTHGGTIGIHGGHYWNT